MPPNYYCTDKYEYNHTVSRERLSSSPPGVFAHALLKILNARWALQVQLQCSHRHRTSVSSPITCLSFYQKSQKSSYEISGFKQSRQQPDINQGKVFRISRFCVWYWL